MKYSVIVPCYNEEKNIKSLVQSLEGVGHKQNIQWILVENGSLDGTRDAINKECEGKAQFTTVYVDKNQGYGYGLQQGIKAASGDYIGWLHADMQISPLEIIRFVKIAESEADKRLFFKVKRRNRSIVEHIFTTGMTLYVSFMFQAWVYDIGAVPVLFHRELLEYMDITPYDFSIDTYVYVVAKKNGFKVCRLTAEQKLRENGESSWNRGLMSRIRQSWIIMKDIAMIRNGKQVK